MAKSVPRLFQQFHPEHYRVHFDLNHDKLTFTGTVTITGQKTHRPNKRLTFHQRGLTITSATITHRGKKEQKVLEAARINHHRKFNEVRLHTEHTLYPGHYSVELQFKGTITRAMQGIYPSFFEHDGKEKYLLSTQFEADHAREAFPCIDEPEAKATFDLELTTAKDLVVLSNMPATSSKAVGTDRQHTIFATTPKMSCYLLAFATGEMHSMEAKTKSGVLVRSWSSVAQPQKLLKYSVTEGVKLLEFYADYFDIPYPLEKLDQIALPDFDAGAMENWGMVTYREVTLLADPDNRSISNEQFVSLVIGHELSHQWFGNLVTMRWWDDLWLNESFAALMEHLSLNTIHPDWLQWETYSVMDILSTTTRDIYRNIQAVSVKITDPELIETLFDPSIVYSKGGRLLKMLREYIGDEAFKKGLHSYFKKHAYSNTSRFDLWEALGASSGKDISSLMTPWLDQAGMPVLHIDQTKKNITLSQQRFMLDETTSDNTWPIPLLASTKLSEDVLTKTDEKVTTGSDDFVLFNQYGSGHYISHYLQANHRAAIVDRIQSQSIPPEARINALNDTILLARHGDASLSAALDIVRACSNEPRDSVWGLISQVLGYTRQLTEGDKKAEEQLKKLRKLLAQNQYKKLGWKDSSSDDPNTIQLRHTMIAYMVGAEDKEAIAIALGMYADAKEIGDIPAELRGTILSAAVRFGEPKVIDRLLKAYPKVSSEIQSDITGALSSTKKPEVAKMIIERALGEKGFVRAQDFMRWLVLFLRNPYTRDVTWNFMEKEWNWIRTTIGESKSFDFIPTYCASIVTTKEWAKKYRDFFEPKKSNKVLKQNIVIGLADIEARVRWRNRDQEVIANWLDQAL